MGYENIDILVESTESFLVKRVLVCGQRKLYIG